jgi:hypothetical protein
MNTEAAVAGKLENQGALSEFDYELDRLMDAIDSLTVVVEPITNRYATENDVMATPKQEPMTALHGRIERLHDLTMRLNEITGQIRL